MYVKASLCVQIFCCLMYSVYSWEIDSLSSNTFTPLKVGNEWVYFDSSWLDVRTDSSAVFAVDSFERTVKITGSFYTADIQVWIADVAIKGTRIVKDAAGDGREESRDTLFSDTLSMPPNGFFAPGTNTDIVSWGMLALFPWFGFEQPCTLESDFGIITTVELFQENYGDTIMKITGNTHQAYGSDDTHSECTITALASVGMVCGTKRYTTLAHNVYRTQTRLKKFNGQGIAVSRYSAPVVRSRPKQNALVRPELYLQRVYLSSGLKNRKIGYDLTGKKIITPNNVASGIIVSSSGIPE